jgi:hypothetical protein
MILTALGKGAGAGALYPEFVGRRGLFVGIGTGPTSYTSGAADPISLALPNYYIDAVCGGVMSTDGTIFAIAGPSGSGTRQTWNLYYYLAAGGQASGNLSTKTFQIAALVGQF